MGVKQNCGMGPCDREHRAVAYTCACALESCRPPGTHDMLVHLATHVVHGSLGSLFSLAVARAGLCLVARKLGSDSTLCFSEPQCAGAALRKVPCYNVSSHRFQSCTLHL